MDTIQISISATETEQDHLIGVLDELGATGFEQRDNILLAYFSALDFNSYEVNKVLSSYRSESVSIPEQNWNAVWESNFQPVKVSSFVGLRAHFHEPLHDVDHEIVITPKMSFGTGHHATTYMMINQMQSLDFNAASVLDFGTGTGVLAILASRLGASRVVAIDNDEWSIKNAEENATTNNCENVTFILTENIPDGPFHIILANINRNVILDSLPRLRQVLVPNGLLLLSGLLTTDQDDIVECCKSHGLVLKNRIEKSNWISLLMAEPDGQPN